MFQTEEEARKLFTAMRLRNRQIGKLLGDHLAMVNLSPSHGNRTAANSDGHFSMFEFAGVDLVPVSQILPVKL